MSAKEKKKFVSKSFKPTDLQKKFILEYLKYKSVKLMNQHEEFLYKEKIFKSNSKNAESQYDEIYGIDSSDFGAIDIQIQRARIKKGRGLLIPLNTYNETKMFDLVRMLL